jgi:tetratricopeptide (TPR) repeat protein
MTQQTIAILQRRHRWAETRLRRKCSHSGKGLKVLSILSSEIARKLIDRQQPSLLPKEDRQQQSQYYLILIFQRISQRSPKKHPPLPPMHSTKPPEHLTPNPQHPAKAPPEKTSIQIRALTQLSSKYYTKGHPEKAQPILEQILRLTENSQDWNELRATILCDLGMIQKSQGNIAQAMLLYQQSLTTHDPTADNKAKALTLTNIATTLANHGHPDRALESLQQSLTIAQHLNDPELQTITLANMAAIAMSQQAIDQSLELLQQSLEIAEHLSDFPSKATVLSLMAMTIAEIGETDCALTLWQQSLELSAQTGDIPTHTNALDKMAIAHIQQGDIHQALTLWQKSIELKQQTNDRPGQAATLVNMAYWYGETGDRPHQYHLNHQAIQTLEQAQAYPDLIKVLEHIGLSAEHNPTPYLAQALWLTLKIAIPPDQTINLIATLFYETPQTELKTLLAATAHYLHTQTHPEPRVTNLLSIAATLQNIPPNAIENWMIQEQLTDPNIFLPRLNQQLETLIGTSWLFDRTRL